ncbi:hypothetical protein PQR08_37605 [Caballeronia jiangsuensis]|uniref:Uncharacterized protein n=1 Tax=Caballeronia jiangsuensis TaxID=1458357 RepID=A0ABW9CYH9_9BURK
MTPSKNRKSEPVQKPRWPASWHFGLWLAGVFFLYIIEALDRLCNLYLGVLLLLGIDASIFLLAAVSTSVSAFASVLEGSWRQLVSVTAAPVLTIGLLAALLHYKIDADWIHFQFTRHRYEKLVRVIPGGSPKYHLWKWGDTGGAAVVNIFYFLAYDESDTPLENFRRAQAPQARFGDLSARPFGDHFYLVTELYP